MKKQLKVLSYVWPLFAGMLFAGCDCLDCVPTVFFNVTPDEVLFYYNQVNEPQTGWITSSCDWHLANPDRLPDWLEVTPRSGGAPSAGIAITATAFNRGNTPREYTLVFKSSCGGEKTVKVTQRGMPMLS